MRRYRYKRYSNNDSVGCFFFIILIAILSMVINLIAAFVKFCSTHLIDIFLFIGFSKSSWPVANPMIFTLLILFSLVCIVIVFKRFLVRKRGEVESVTEESAPSFNLIDYEFQEYEDRNGYIKVFVPKYRHRMLAEKLLKRRLLPNEIVHHIDGRRSNNDPTNLCVMDRMRHEHFHAWMEWKKSKENSYPSIWVLKAELRKDIYGGILLESFVMNDGDLEEE